MCLGQMLEVAALDSELGSTALKSWLGHWLAERDWATNLSVNEGLEEVRSRRT